MLNPTRLAWCAAAAMLVVSSQAQAQRRTVTATVTNLAPTNSISFAPLHVGFHSGVFDSFNNGEVAGAGIVSVAEGGSGVQWQADFAAAEPTATLPPWCCPATISASATTAPSGCSTTLATC